MVAEIKSRAEFSEKVLTAKGPVIVDFYATWCGPCKAIAPKVDEFSEKYTSAAFYKVDVDEVSEVAAEVGITAMPTFILFKDGEKVETVMGANPRALEAGIQKIVA